MQYICAGGQDSVQSSIGPTNVFSLTQDDIKDETGEEESYYVNCLIHHIVMPETLPSNLDTNGHKWTQMAIGGPKRMAVFS